MERYLEAAQQILDRAIITPDLLKTFTAAELLPASRVAAVARELAPGKELSAPISIYLDGDYDVRVAVERKDGMGTLALKVDGATAVPLAAVQAGAAAAADRAEAGARRASADVRGSRSARARTAACSRVVADGAPVTIASLTVQQKPSDAHAREAGAALSAARRRAGRRTAPAAQGGGTDPAHLLAQGVPPPGGSRRRRRRS